MTSPEKGYVLQVDDLDVRYSSEIDVLRGVSFALQPNEIVGLIGAGLLGLGFAARRRT